MTPQEQAQSILQRLQAFSPTSTPREQSMNTAATNMAVNPMAGESFYNASANAGAGDVNAALAKMSPLARSRAGVVAPQVGQHSLRTALLGMYPQLVSSLVTGANMETGRFAGLAGANTAADRMRLGALTGSMQGLSQTSDLMARDRTLDATRRRAGVQTQGDVLNDKLRQAQQSIHINQAQAANSANYGGAYNWAGNQNQIPYLQAVQQGNQTMANLRAQLQALGYAA
jgi:hypothetical protein